MVLKKSFIILWLCTLYFYTNAKEQDKTSCLSCAIQRGELESIGGIIAFTDYFEARQDYAIPIPGFIIIASKRHIQSIDAFTVEERKDFIEFLYTMRKKMRELLKIDTVYVIQEEDSSHFHVWLFPRYAWMEQFGTKINSVKPIMRWAREHLTTEEDVKKVLACAAILKKCC